MTPQAAGKFRHRAAIREFDGGQAREHAEAEALQEVVQRMRAADSSCTPGAGNRENKS